MIDDPRYADALDFVVARFRGRKWPIEGLTESEMAEFLILAPTSLWYTQARAWSEGQFDGLAGDTAMLQMAGQVVVDMVNMGHNPQATRAINKWWDSSAWTNEERAAGLLLFLDMASMLEEIRQTGPLYVISQGFGVFFALVIGPDWRTAVQKFKADPQAFIRGVAALVQKAPVQNPVQSCIAPHCKTMVDRRQKRSGACSQAHLRYWCSKCSCWHHWGTRIAGQHQAFFVCDWSPAVAKEKKDASLVDS